MSTDLYSSRSVGLMPMHRTSSSTAGTTAKNSSTASTDRLLLFPRHPVCRKLFGSPSSSSSSFPREILRRQAQMKQEEYGYNFEKDCPIPGGRYKWERIPPEEYVPEAYRCKRLPYISSHVKGTKVKDSSHSWSKPTSTSPASSQTSNMVSQEPDSLVIVTSAKISIENRTTERSSTCSLSSSTVRGISSTPSTTEESTVQFVQSEESSTSQNMISPPLEKPEKCKTKSKEVDSNKNNKKSSPSSTSHLVNQSTQKVISSKISPTSDEHVKSKCDSYKIMSQIQSPCKKSQSSYCKSLRPRKRKFTSIQNQTKLTEHFSISKAKTAMSDKNRKKKRNA